MLLKDSEDTIAMPANCSDKISSNEHLNPMNGNHENEILHHKLCSMPKSLNSTETSPSTSPSPTVNIIPENIVPYNIVDRQRKLRYTSHDTCYEDDLYILEPKPAPQE